MRSVHPILNYVIARHTDIGGFSAVPSLPVSVEDTYHALRILKALLPISKRYLFSLRRDRGLRMYLEKAEGRETWTFKTVFQYISACSIVRVNVDRGWLDCFLNKRSKGDLQLIDHYYRIKILREFKKLRSSKHQVRCWRWRTVKELLMILYISGESRKNIKKKNDLIKWLQACQNPDGGFGFLPGTTSFIENSHWCLKALTLLNAQPSEIESARDFILRCKTSSGGFARKNGSAPFLDATWHAVASLSFLERMSQ